MSKLDAQRAMREANYARRQSAAPPRPRTDAPVAPPAERTASTPRSKPGRAKAAPVAPGSAASTETGTCGHRSMNGRTCTREAGHSEKSHRYG